MAVAHGDHPDPSRRDRALKSVGSRTDRASPLTASNASGGAGSMIASVVASQLATAIAGSRQGDRDLDDDGHSDQVTGTPFRTSSAAPSEQDDPGAVVVRYFPDDASTFFDGDYLIKGVAGPRPVVE